MVRYIGIVSQLQRASAAFIQAANKHETIYEDQEGREYELSEAPDFLSHALQIPSSSAPPSPFPATAKSDGSSGSSAEDDLL